MIVQYGKLIENKSSKSGAKILVIGRCLFCNARHTHGWPDPDETEPQPRVPHCHRGPMGPDSAAWERNEVYYIAPRS